MKNLAIVVTLLVSVTLLPMISFGQEVDKEDEKQMKVKIVKEKDGERTVIDTAFTVHEIIDAEDMVELKAIIDELDLEDLDIEIGDLDKTIEDLDLEVIELDHGAEGMEKTVVIKRTGSGEDELEKNVHVVYLSSDSAQSGKVMKMTVGEDSYGYIITDSDEDHEVKWTEGGKQLIMIKSGDGEETEVVFSGDEDLKWVGEHSSRIEVVDGEQGKKVIVKDKEGNTREYDLPEEKGTYIIGEDGEFKKIENDVKWKDAPAGTPRVAVTVGEGKDVLVISDDGEVIELTEAMSDHSVILRQVDGEPGTQQVFVEVIEKKEGDKTIRVKSKVIVGSPSQEDIESLVKSGVDIAVKEDEQLSVTGLQLHPNPSTGKFTLEFTAPEKEATSIVIYNLHGVKVYEEKIADFKGKYKKEIDISGEKRGTYFLEINQGDKRSARKIILE